MSRVPQKSYEQAVSIKHKAYNKMEIKLYNKINDLKMNFLFFFHWQKWSLRLCTSQNKQRSGCEHTE